MIKSIKQEFKKMTFRKITWVSTLLLPVWMITMAIGMNHQDDRLLIMTNYNSSMYLNIVLILVGSTMFSMEYQNNSILTLLYKAPRKLIVFFSKFSILFLYNVFLHCVAIFFTLVFQLTPLKISLSWFVENQYGQSLLMNMINYNLIDIVSMTLIISLVCLISCLINSNSIVILISLMVGFFGQNISSSLLMANNSHVNIIRWNPFNMINLTNQYYNYKTYHLTSFLTNQQLLLGTLVYIGIFLTVGYLIFRKKRF